MALLKVIGQSNNSGLDLLRVFSGNKEDYQTRISDETWIEIEITFNETVKSLDNIIVFIGMGAAASQPRIFQLYSGEEKIAEKLSFYPEGTSWDKGKETILAIGDEKKVINSKKLNLRIQAYNNKDYPLAIPSISFDGISYSNKYLFKDGEEIKSYGVSEWVKYEAGLLPNNSTPAWTKINSEVEGLIENGVLNINDAGSGFCTYSRTNVVSQNEIVKLKARVKVLSSSNNFLLSDSPPLMIIRDGVRGVLLALFPTKIQEYKSGLSYNLDLTNYREIELIKKGTTGWEIFVDGVKVLSGSVFEPTTAKDVSFSGGSSSGRGNSYWDYVYYSASDLENRSMGLIGVGIVEPTKELFDLHGMSDLSLITNEAIQQLQSDQVELLCWTDEVGVIEPGSSIIPAMTGYNIPAPYVVSASQENSSMQAWKAFNGIASGLTSAYNEWSTNGTPSGWIKIDLGVKEKVVQYSLTNNDRPERMAKNWVLEGSNDDINWNQIDQKTEENLWGSVETRTYDILNPVEYRYYRLNVSANNGGASYLQISEIKLIREGETIPLSRAANVTAVPHPKLLLPIGDIGVGENVESILLDVAVAVYSDLKVVASADSGTTWMGKTQVDIADLASVKANGFTPEEFNALTKEQLTTLFPNGTARFAFYLEQDNLTDVVEIQSLTINEKKYTISPTVSDISVIYEVLKSEQPILFISRDDGVTWREVSQDEVESLSDLPEGNQLRVKAVLEDGQEVQAISYSWA
ncbi:discoidin domain-containing protein [Rhodococcus sp. IEGM1300]